nr:DUF3883 domain-containing protein [Enterococcus sp. MJM16]
MKNGNKRFITDFFESDEPFYLLFYTYDPNTKTNRYVSIARAVVALTEKPDISRLLWNDSDFPNIWFLDKLVHIDAKDVDTEQIKSIVEKNYRYANYLTEIPDSLLKYLDSDVRLDNNTEVKHDSVEYSKLKQVNQVLKPIAKSTPPHPDSDKSTISIDYTKRAENNKKIGDKGEDLAFDLIKDKFTDITKLRPYCKERGGDRFGVDFLVETKTGKHLIEVKSTTSKDNRPFHMSQNEYYVMESCKNNLNGYENYQYHILRIYGISLTENSNMTYCWLNNFPDDYDFSPTNYIVGGK